MMNHVRNKKHKHNKYKNKIKRLKLLKKEKKKEKRFRNSLIQFSNKNNKLMYYLVFTNKEHVLMYSEIKYLMKDVKRITNSYSNYNKPYIPLKLLSNDKQNVLKYFTVECQM